MKLDIYFAIQFLPALVNHLLQTTAVFFLVWVLTAMLQRHRAALRFRLWMAASLKFLVPFSLLIAAGQHLRPEAAQPVETRAVGHLVTQAVQPYAGPVLPSQMLAPVRYEKRNTKVYMAEGMVVLWMLGACAVFGLWLRNWMIGAGIARRAAPWMTMEGLAVRKTRGVLEPCVFGLIRPVLLMPEDLPARLTAQEIDAIVAHELCHVRRRDNLTAALHAAVTALFWFHPAVWFVRARLLDERERACDEGVVVAGNDRELYAQSILNVCRMYAEAPADAMAGVTGGELTQRIVRIMTEAASMRLSGRRKMLLASAAALLCGLPLAAGVLGARAAYADDAGVPIPFEVFSIRPTSMAPQSGAGGPLGGIRPDGYSAHGWDLWSSIMMAYSPRDFHGWKSDDIVNYPKSSWAKTRYDIDARIPAADIARWREQDAQHELLSAALREALQERCHMAAHVAQRERPVFALTLGKKPPKYDKVTGAQIYPENSFAVGEGVLVPGNHPRLLNVSMTTLAEFLSNGSDRHIVDSTGLKGLYNITLIRLPYEKRDASEPRPASPFFDLEASGFSLKPTTAMLPTIVIDHLEPPTPN
ncbi:M56 family metallopeptidase [Silvibacterium sp.]|uniref:M56 family metallopeptidase n=1 Tax=Silvibacterium sp. TaxID=1964179 RepID=UPI0039E63D91